MFARPNLPIYPLGLRLREVQIALGAWGLYVFLQAVYCLVYARIISADPFNLRGMLVWAVGEWGVWLPLTLFIFRALRRYETAPNGLALRSSKLAVATLTLSLAVRVGFDHFTGAREIQPSLVIFVPRYVAAVGVVFATWFLFLRSRPSTTNLPPEKTADPPAITHATEKYPSTLLVGKGRDESLIQVEKIQYASAAGNYVEIYSDNHHYLMRVTMKQLEQMLPPSRFVRVHRSHIVNIEQIERIKTQPSGNGRIYLRCGKVFGLSKKYRALLQSHS